MNFEGSNLVFLTWNMYTVKLTHIGLRYSASESVWREIPSHTEGLIQLKATCFRPPQNCWQNSGAPRCLTVYKSWKSYCPALWWIDARYKKSVRLKKYSVLAWRSTVRYFIKELPCTIRILSAVLSSYFGPGYLSRYNDSLRFGRSGSRIPVGARFSAPVQACPGTHPASYTMGTGSFPGVKRQGCGVYHPHLCSAKFKGRVEVYLYSPSGPTWPVLGWTLPLRYFTFDL
jgi:hypothetical protein